MGKVDGSSGQVGKGRNACMHSPLPNPSALSLSSFATERASFWNRKPVDDPCLHCPPVIGPLQSLSVMLSLKDEHFLHSRVPSRLGLHKEVL